MTCLLVLMDVTVTYLATYHMTPDTLKDLPLSAYSLKDLPDSSRMYFVVNLDTQDI